METKLEIKQLRKKFTQDLNLPIQIIHSPYFENRIALLEDEFKAQSKYNALLLLINEHFEGNINKFLEYRHNVINDILSHIENCEAYKKFINDKSVLVDYTPIIGSRELYTMQESGNFFVSYDMIKANFQVLKNIDPSIVNGCDTYEDFIDGFTHIDYFKNAKQLRQETLGKLNSKRTAAIEKRVSNAFAEELHHKMWTHGFDLFSIKTDEIIFKFKGNEEKFKEIMVHDEEFGGYKFRVNKFKLTQQEFKRHTSESRISAFIKESYLNGNKRTIHCVSDVYYPQVYKLLNDMEIEESDLVFYFDHELSKFMYPLEIVKPTIN